MSDLSAELGIPLLLSEKALAVIGALTGCYSYMEFLAAAAVWHSLGIKPYDGTFVTSGQSLQQRLALVQALGEREKITTKDLEEIGTIAIEFSKTGGLTARRNSVIHAFWVTDEDGKKVFPQIFSKSGKVMFGDYVTRDSLVSLIKDMAVQIRKLQVIVERWGALEAPISFQKPPKSSP